MKKTVKISLGGLSYIMDDDAFSLLENYINTLKVRLQSDTEGKDIIQDIEERIAELFAEKKGSADSVSIDVVKEVLEILGNPDEIASGDTTSEKTSSTYRSQKRLYRDRDHSYIAGVCSGLGEYFGTDPVVLRIIFLVLLFLHGSGLIIYLILWIAVPRALTPKQKLEMKGEPINISTIEKTIREESAQAKDTVKKGGIRGAIEGVVNFIGRLAYWFIQFLLVIIKIIAIIIAIVLIATMLIGLFVLVNVIFFGGFLLHSAFPEIQGIPLGEVITSMFEFSTSIWITIPIFLVIAIPLFTLLYIGIRILFRFKARDRIIGLIAATIWVASVVILSLTIFYQAKSFTIRKHVTETVTLTPKISNGGTFYIKAIDPKNGKDFRASNEIEIDEYTIAKIDGKTTILGRPSIFMEKSKTEYPTLEIVRTARGVNALTAELNAKNIKYNYTLKDSVIYFDSYFSIPTSEKWKIQDVSITLSVPEGYKIDIDSSMENILNPYQPRSEYWPDEMINRKWEMKEKTLRELEKK